MLNELFKYAKKPERYAQNTCLFWDDEHISKGMLEAHLDPDFEAASRPHKFIDQSVNWISNVAPAKTFNRLLDLGCGPGLYTNRFYQKGYNVTGIDFSKRSIAYAKEQASEKALKINYLFQNYLNIDYKKQFDLVTLIYGDYCVLPDNDRKKLLKNVYRSLREGGKFIFDVFTENEFIERQESNTWYASEGSCFWKPDRHICLESHYIYEQDNLRLDQFIIIDKEGKVDVIRNWLKWYTKETIIAELEQVGFNKFEIFSDVTGKPFDEQSKTLCIVVEK